MMTERRSPKPRQHGGLSLILAGGVAGVAVGLAGVYGIGRVAGNAAVDPACRPAVETARRIAPLARGEVAAVTAVADAPIRLPDLAFRTPTAPSARSPTGAAAPCCSISGPPGACPAARRCRRSTRCRRKLGGADFEVVAVNIDTRDPDKPRAWLKEVGIERLAYYADPSAKVFQDLKAGRQGLRHADHAARRSGAAARSARWRARRNGRARTRSSSSPRRSGGRN